MLEFDMPDKSEKYRYGKTKAALEALAGKPIGDITVFELDITEGNILETLIKRTELKGFQKRFGLGCPVSREAPYFEYSLKDNGTEIRYRREIRPFADGFYADGVACVGRIVSALNDKGNCWEEISFYERRQTAAKVFRDAEGWRMTLNRCRVGGKEIEREGFDMSDAVNLALDFYNSNNL